MMEVLGIDDRDVWLLIKILLFINTVIIVNKWKVGMYDSLKWHSRQNATYTFFVNVWVKP